jgi:hypothetical protein
METGKHLSMPMLGPWRLARNLNINLGKLMVNSTITLLKWFLNAKRIISNSTDFFKNTNSHYETV